MCGTFADAVAGTLLDVIDAQALISGLRDRRDSGSCGHLGRSSRPQLVETQSSTRAPLLYLVFPAARDDRGDDVTIDTCLREGACEQEAMLVSRL